MEKNPIFSLNIATFVLSIFLVCNFISFSAVPWAETDVVQYPLPMTIVGEVTILGNAADSGDVVAILAGSEVVGLSTVTDISGQKLVNLTTSIDPGTKSFSVDSGTGEFVFDPGSDEITFQVWDSSADTTYTAIQTPIPSAGVNLGDFGTSNFYSIEVKADLNLNVPLNENWNHVSLNVRLDDMKPGNVFSSIIGSVNKIISGNEVYDPQFDTPELEVLNSLKVLSDGIGFYVNVTGTPTLSITGRLVDPKTELSLSVGWNNRGYLLDVVDLKIGTGLLNIINNNSNLNKVISGNNVYDPQFDTPELDVLNSLKKFTAGNGYWINVSNNQVFTYESQ